VAIEYPRTTTLPFRVLWIIARPLPSRKEFIQTSLTEAIGDS
jgi:hypothetical protein